MNPKQFLIANGALFFIIGILGFVGILGPIADKSVLHMTWYFTMNESTANVLVGIICLFASYAFPEQWQKYLTILIGVVAILVALYGWISGPNLFGVYLVNPTDNIFHLIVGAWALYASVMNKKHVAL